MYFTLLTLLLGGSDGTIFNDRLSEYDTGYLAHNSLFHLWSQWDCGALPQLYFVEKDAWVRNRLGKFCRLWIMRSAH